MELSDELKAELARLKGAFPWRICYCALKEGHEPLFGAVFRRNKPNKLLREGWAVFEQKGGGL